MSLRIAFFGAGQMARHHLAAVQRLAGAARVVGVYDRAAAPAEALAGRAGCPAFPSPDALFREARPDLVHVCTPPPAHFEAAMAALQGGAHVYVEKPFALSVRDGRAILDAAAEGQRLVCAGHQLLRDPAFERLMAGSAGLGHLVRVDSDFAFRPAGAAASRAGGAALAKTLVDILPHPLYSLVSVLERFAPGEPIEIAGVQATPTDVQALIRADDLVGRLSVSLRARPVASSLTLTGTHGALTCDFVRSMVVGAANPGTEPLEKILNPVIEGSQLQARSALGLVRRIRSGSAYPGLFELIDSFYRAAATGGRSPVSPAHLLTVTSLFESLVSAVEAAAGRTRSARPAARARHGAPLVAVTGARGFLGREICRVLPRVRGIGRGSAREDVPVEQWVGADLGNGLAPEAVAGADVVVHAAAETAGGYAEHQRNTIDATRNLLRAMHAAGVSRLVLVSSLSVLEPPRSAWDRQDEGTPHPRDARPLGAYTWGKCRQEELVTREAPALGIATRIVRPGALIDWRDPVLPGLMGRRLLGRWHLALGRPNLPIPVCGLDRCAEVIAWCAAHFDEAPPVLNLFDPGLSTRGAVLARLRASGHDGRMLWVPISVLAAGLTVARTAFSLARGRRPERLAAWSVLRPRRYDSRLASAVLEASGGDAGLVEEEVALRA
jgi:predicted dehydrogenase/nucleoside-diphosphate-sugar epimerase